jgi:phosphatidylglycerol:prolipoprotein diacylglycerol transferase
MLPYYSQPVWTAGPFTISAFGMFAAAAILVGLVLTRRAAGRLGLEADTASRLARLVLVGGFAGGIAGGFSSAAALVAGAATGVTYLTATRQGFRYFEPAALAFPWPCILFRAGCALAHDHRGAPSTSILAVQFPEGPRLDLGLLEMLAMIPVAVAFTILARKTRPAGFYSGLLALSYGAIRLLLSGFRMEPANTPVYSLAAIAIGMVVLSVSFMWRRVMCSGQ